MSNSPLVSFVKLSPNCTKPRNHKIDTITIHVMDGDLTVEQCLSLPRFQTPDPRGGASCNYAVDSSGRIGMGVEEVNRSWCTSSASNDHRAITIEVANDGGKETGYHVSDAALAALVELLTDICARNGIPRLLWQGDKSLIGQVEKQNMTVHRWFAAKACPGDYLYGKHGEIAAAVNRRLAVGEECEECEACEGCEACGSARYLHLSDIPSPDFRRVIALLMEAGVLSGYGPDETGENVLDLSEDMVRGLVLAYRGGAYDRKLMAQGFPPAVDLSQEQEN